MTNGNLCVAQVARLSAKQLLIKSELVPNEPLLQGSATTQSTTDSHEHHVEHDLILEGISCSACIWLLERHLRQLPGIISFKINYATRRAHIESLPELVQFSQILEAIQSIGYQAYLYDPSKQFATLQQERKGYISRIGVALFCGMQVMMITLGLYMADSDDIDPQMLNFLIWASALLTLPIILFSAQPFFQSAWRDIKNRQPGMDVPVALGIGLAFIASLANSITQTGETYYESVAMFVIFLLIARYLEFLTRWYAMSASERMTQTAPTIAKKLDSGGGFETVPATSLQIGDDIQINPGAVIPADSMITHGESHVDEAIITGENDPIKKHVGDYLLGGSHNLESNLIATVTCISEKSTLSTITRLVEHAQMQKPHWVTVADRYASWFVVAVITLTGLSALSGWLNNDPNWFSTALSVLVVTCPCALSLATPTAYTKLASINRVIFDKTGTLTEGSMAISNFVVHTSTSQQSVLDIAASLETHSDHPIAQAFLTNKSDDALKATDITHTNGQGISGNINGNTYYLGSKKFIDKLLGAKIETTPTHNTQVFLANETQLIASFEVGNTIRKGVKPLMHWLKNQGKSVSLLSGDHDKAVSSFAHQIDIDSYTAGVSPAEKLQLIENIQVNNEAVVMVGDGINDAPVLAKADVSISVSSASQLASASSDILLLRNDMSNLKHVFLLSKKTKQVILQNMSWALLYNLGALPLALLGYVEPWQAALGMSVSSLVVVLNSFRIKIQSASYSKPNNPLTSRPLTNG